MPDIDRPAHARDAGFFAAAWPFTGRKGARSRMTPLFQGKIDNFCAAYAVLNAMRLIHGISDLQARALFSELLLSQSRDEKAFRAILSHGTDYVDMVDAFLGQISERFPLRVSAPFDAETACDEVWAALAAYARPEQGRSAVFRFRRYEAFCVRPRADHWTAAHRMEGGVLRFFDCSLEPDGLYHLTRQIMKDDVDQRVTEYVVVPPESVRLMERVGAEDGAYGDAYGNGAGTWRY